MLEKLSIRERNLLVILLGIVLISIIYFGLAKYLYPQYRQVKDELIIRKQDLADINGRIIELNNLESRNSELQNRLLGMTNSFNKEVRNGVNYYYIGKHAIDNGVIIREILPQKYEDYDQYIKIPLKMTVRGKYRDVLKYIEQVENDMPNTSEIISLEIHPAGWDTFTESSEEGNEGAANESTKETKEAAKDEKIEQKLIPVVNSITQKIAESASPSTSNQTAEVVSPLLRLFSDVDPDVDVKITLVTYAVKSPEIMELAKDIPVGRLDAFSPTVEIPIVEPEPEENIEDVLFPGEGDFSDIGEDFDSSGGNPSLPENEDLEETQIPPVPKVTVKETGDFSFPVRQNDRDKEEIANDE